jgi:hypothetical protein
MNWSNSKPSSSGSWQLQLYQHQEMSHGGGSGGVTWGCFAPRDQIYMVVVALLEGVFATMVMVVVALLEGVLQPW